MVFPRMSGVMMMVLMIVVTTTKVAEGQSNPPSCAAKLVPCANYLNSTSPPKSCCDPLKEAITNELTCLCNLYADPNFLANVGINVTLALKLPGHCGLSGDLSACGKAQGPSSSSEPPPAVPGGKDNNGVGKIAGAGFSSLLLLLASVMLC